MCVTDCGPGVAPYNLGKVFDAFWTTKEKGLGIGLAVCQSIVVAHGGSIIVFNNADRGATFCITLPVKQTA